MTELLSGWWGFTGGQGSLWWCKAMGGNKAAGGSELKR